MQRTQSLYVLLVIVVHTALAVGYAVATPLWLNSDEPAHYNYVREIADGGALPLLRGPEDFDQTSLGQMVRSNFQGSPDVSHLRYESFQPPLYYLIGAALLELTGGSTWQQVLWLRLFNIVLGNVTLVVIYFIGRNLWPDKRDIAVGAVACVALIPGHVATTAQPRSDVLAELLFALVILLSLLRLDGLSERRFVVAGGILVGLGCLTRLSMYVAPAILLVADIGYQRKGRMALTRTLSVLSGILLIALAIAGWWFVRNALSYGMPDVLALGIRQQLADNELHTTYNLAGLRFFLVFTYKSFWGIFGWMGVQLDIRLYWLLGFLTSAIVAGCVLFVRQQAPALSQKQRMGLALLGLQLALVIATLVWYNLELRQPQGRFLYQASPAIGLLTYLGLREISSRPGTFGVLLIAGCAALAATGRGLRFAGLAVVLTAGLLALRAMAKERQAAVVFLVSFALMVGLNVWCIFGVILPAFG